MSSRLYFVNVNLPGHEMQHLVEANSQGQALRCIANRMMTVSVASAKQVGDYMRLGGNIENGIATEDGPVHAPAVPFEETDSTDL